MSRQKGKYNQTARVMRILDRLKAQPDGATLAVFAEEFAVTVRQIRRDLDALDQAGHSWEHVMLGKNPGVRLTERTGIDVTLSQRERYALFAARRVFDVLEGTPLHEDLHSIFDKLVATLPEEQKKELIRFGDRFVYLPDGGTKSYAEKDEVLDALFTGVLRRRWVQIAYRAKSGEITRGKLAPYAIVLYKQGLYAIGRVDSEPDHARTFAVERFQDAEAVRGEAFDMPDDFRVDRYFNGAFGIYLGDYTEHVVIDFAPEARELVEARTWHPSQKLQRLEDGGVRLELDVSDLIQVRNWAVGWGPLAIVRAPEKLVKHVEREHREAAAHYA
jgi:predicted DNA-binding transcriptional regulator YafY